MSSFPRRRFLTQAPEARSASSCFAPLVKFAITPGLDFSYEAALALGHPEDIRRTFEGLRGKLLTPALPGTGS